MTFSSQTPSAEFLALTEKYLAGESSPEELRRWETLCLENPDALAYYLSLSRTEGLLPEALARLQAAGARRAIPFYRRPVFVAGLAAALALTALSAFMLPALFPEKPVSVASIQKTGVPARVTGSVGVRWTEGAAGQGERLAHAAGVFSAGLLELTLDSGVRLLVQGPAVYAVTGPNSIRLERGRAVADVPLNARGFTLTSPRDRIIDHGTRFAVDVAPDGEETTLGVLSGEVELINGAKEVRLFTDYAVRRSGDEVLSVPFDKSRFVTETPSREFPWSLDGAKHDVVRTLSFDVTNLVHGPGDYRIVVRWLLGHDAVTVKSLRLERDGVVVARTGDARSGDIEKTEGNAPVLRISAEAAAKPGRWALVMDACCEGAGVVPPRPTSSQGVVSFEEGLSLTADAKRFVGRWRYSHDGTDFIREFLDDGTARLFINGKPVLKSGYESARYTVADGVLTLNFTDGKPAESHMLRDDRTLVFLNRPYRNACRE